MEEQQEVEYYWDTDSQAYYYWDEDTQAYYMWEEEDSESAGLGEVREELQCNNAIGSAASPSQQDTNAVNDQNRNASSLVEGNEREANDRISGGVGDTGVTDQKFSRAMSRRMSFRDYGGLVGCLQQAATERQARKETIKLTDDEIKRNARLQLAREMATVSGERHSIGHTSRIHSTEESVDTVESLSASESAAAARNRPRGSTSVRFGTKEFSDPAFQSRLEAMLGSQVRKT